MNDSAVERRHLKYFVAVAEELHFGRAAERLGIAAPTLTVQIQEVERSLSARLFARSNRAVALMPAGEAFLVEARAVLDRFERAESVGRRAGRGEIGRIEVGYVGSAVYVGVLQDLIIGFRASHPDVETVARELPMPDVPAMLEAGSLDVGLVRLPMDLPPGLQRHVLAEDDFCVALPAGHPEASAAGAIRAARLRTEPFVVPEQTSGTNEVGRRGGFAPRIVASPGSLAAVLAQVSLGHGIAVVPCVVAEAIRIPGVAFRALAGEPVTSEVAAVYRHGDASGAVAAFLGRIEGSTKLRLRHPIAS